MCVARFFSDCYITFNCANFIYYQGMIDVIASMGFGYKGLNYDALRVKLLLEVKHEVNFLIDSNRSVWIDIGCTIVADG